ALQEYSTRDYIEKDFNDLKNSLDMKNIRVHDEHRMRARLFLQLVSEIYMRTIMLRISKNKATKGMPMKEVFNHIKAIHKISFKGKHKDVCPSLSKKQRDVLNAISNL
ncbi:MAG: hypothetical protein LBF12_06200, partial [Christensenellaceae bacterium]|nr:hypothetical protein [Christensenellaceae bacterium]